MKNFFLFGAVYLLAGCAALHHVQLGEVVSHPDYNAQPFDIKISETGVDINEAKNIAKLFMSKESQKQADDIAGIVGLFQMGPRTGNTVYTKGYAKNLIRAIYEKCPSGRVTGLMSIRESRKYPVISGEIAKVTGYCLIRKGA
jgi:hypothetical protein